MAICNFRLYTLIVLLFEPAGSIGVKNNATACTIFSSTENDAERQRQAARRARPREFKEAVEDLGIAHGFVIQFSTTADEPISEMRMILSERSAVIDQDKMALQLSHIREPSDLFGMTKVSRACQAIRVAYQANDKERCLTCIRELKNEIAYVKPRLHQLISYERNIRDAGGRI
ncbi:hypothetical protein LUZ62_053729 [Rhynchospora pubera]|uniref:Uncharacterized protein n=1 Tax=Rhynchospora pubera TaxID=906938 RepID=A0AAV8DTA9_9POAL|nr:hypothetical protein LUZ62_053729 [Rhynchospora pubera]